MDRKIEIGKETKTKTEARADAETGTETEARTDAEVETEAEARAAAEVEIEAETEAETDWEPGTKVTAGDRGWQGESLHQNWIGKYTVIRQLGSGGEGTVYLAQDEDLHRPVAVKRLCGQEDRRQVGDRQVIWEADMLKELRHPMLPVIHELLWDSAWYLVMEYVPGITLREYIDRNGCVREEQACAWLTQLLDVTAYLHSRKPPVIYRDFKPDNIMVCPDGCLRLVDFGAADIRNYGSRTGGVMAVTPGYAAPEQLGKGAAPEKRVRFVEGVQTGAGRKIYADERSDIYALGKILYYMVTGADPAKPPYTALPIRDYQPLLSSALEKVIRRCIEDDPGRRYQMADQVWAALAACGRRGKHLRRRTFIRAVEKRVWLTEMQDGTLA